MFPIVNVRLVPTDKGWAVVYKQGCTHIAHTTGEVSGKVDRLFFNALDRLCPTLGEFQGAGASGEYVWFERYTSTGVVISEDGYGGVEAAEGSVLRYRPVLSSVSEPTDLRERVVPLSALEVSIAEDTRDWDHARCGADLVRWMQANQHRFWFAMAAWGKEHGCEV